MDETMLARSSELMGTFLPDAKDKGKSGFLTTSHGETQAHKVYNENSTAYLSLSDAK